MSRFQRAFRGVVSGYGVLAAVALYSLASIPLALTFLSEKEFALWVLMAGIAGYLTLIDLGMSNSLARLLIDHKDEREGNLYGSLIKTGAAVLLVQGGLVLVAGFAFAPWLAQLLKIPLEFQATFIALLKWQSGLLAFSFCIRIFSHILQAHQRLDFINYSQIATTGLNFLSLWIFLKHGQGVYSLVWGNLVAAIFNAAALLICCWKFQLFPRRGFWGTVQWVQFRNLFIYGKDIFLVSVGTQLIIASQTMIITRKLGLEAAAFWAVGTKLFTLVSQVIWRISDSSAPAFSEMIVRKEAGILQERYKSMVMLTASLAAFGAVSYALCNSTFVRVFLTRGEMWWPSTNDVLLGTWMIISAIQRCHNSFILLTKKIGFMRYIFFVEGIVFVAVALLTVRWGGLPAIITASICCSLIFSGAYGVWRISLYFNYPLQEITIGWLKPMSKILACYIPVALLTWWGGQYLNDIMRLTLFAIVCGSLGVFFFLRHGISGPFRVELLHRAPEKISPLLRRLLIGSTK